MKPPSGGFCRSASACPDFGAYAIHPWRGLSHRDDQPIAKTKITSFLQHFCDWGLPFAPAKRKESQYSHFAALSDLNLRSGELATIPNRKNVAIRSDFLFWAHGLASGRCWGGGVPDRLLDCRRMLWFRIRVVPWLAHVLIDLACVPNLEFDLLIFGLVLLCLRSGFGVCADSRIRTALWCGMRVLVFWCAIIAGHIISFERLVHG